MNRFPARQLDGRGLFLHARSLVLLGDTQRDQGVLTGPLSADRTYRRALAMFTELDIPRRVAQIELSLAVVAEMTGELQPAARLYQRLADDERLSNRDRARSLLWVGTALSKDGNHQHAARVMSDATHMLEDLGECEDWSVGQQKLALAFRGAGDLSRALKFIDVARSSGADNTPMQQVRLSTAHAHILLSDRATCDHGLALLSETRDLAVTSGLAHQVRSIQAIRHGFENAGGHAADRNAGTPRDPSAKGGHVTRQDQGGLAADAQRADAQLIWDYHQLHHQLRPCSAGIGLGSHDLGVAELAARLYHAGLFPVLVFSGANSPTTVGRFPRGEAVHYAEHAMQLGVPKSAIIIEPRAANTGQNISYSRRALTDAGVQAQSVLLISKPYMERRAFATTRKVWPQVEAVCASEPLALDDYVKQIGDEKLVIDMLVGDLQRLVEYPALGFAIAQHVPAEVEAAYRRLLGAGFDTRLLRT